MPDGGVGEHVAEERGDGVAVVGVPKAQEIGPSELPAELLANLRAGEPEPVAQHARTFGNEGFRQNCRDLGRLDLETTRCHTAIAYAIPIRVKLPTRWLLH